MHYLDFERPIAELEGKIVELRTLAEQDPNMDINGEVAKLQSRAGEMVRETYAKLTPWQKVLVARHPARPHFLDYAKTLLEEFTPLAGDRQFAEDQAIVAGLARFRGRAVAFLGQERGNDTQSRLKHNFGMAMPEGYRKAVRLFELADRFGLPVLSFVDTSGAFPGVILGVLTWRQCRAYHDMETFYRAILDRNPDCWMAHTNLGATYQGNGDWAKATEQFRKPCA